MNQPQIASAPQTSHLYLTLTLDKVDRITALLRDRPETGELASISDCSLSEVLAVVDYLNDHLGEVGA